MGRDLFGLECCLNEGCSCYCCLRCWPNLTVYLVGVERRLSVGEFAGGVELAVMVVEGISSQFHFIRIMMSKTVSGLEIDSEIGFVIVAEIVAVLE